MAFSPGNLAFTYEALEAQQQLFPAENALCQIEVSRRLVTVQIYEALWRRLESRRP